MPKYVAAIDQGTTSTRCILFDHAGNIVCLRTRKNIIRSIPSPAGWNMMRSKSGNTPSMSVQRRVGQIRGGGGRYRCHRHHQPARDHPGVGAPDRPPGLQRHRLAGYAHRYDLQRTGQRWRSGSLARQDRPAAGDLFLRAKDQMDPG